MRVSVNFAAMPDGALDLIAGMARNIRTHSPAVSAAILNTIRYERQRRAAPHQDRAEAVLLLPELSEVAARRVIQVCYVIAVRFAEQTFEKAESAPQLAAESYAAWDFWEWLIVAIVRRVAQRLSKHAVN